MISSRSEAQRTIQLISAQRDARTTLRVLRTIRNLGLGPQWQAPGLAMAMVRVEKAVREFGDLWHVQIHDYPHGDIPAVSVVECLATLDELAARGTGHALDEIPDIGEDARLAEEMLTHLLGQVTTAEELRRLYASTQPGGASETCECPTHLAYG